MNLKKKISQIFILFLILIFTSCSSGEKDSFDDSYYQKTEKEWFKNLPAGAKTGDLRDHVLLVIQTTECSPCLQELAWWNTKGKKEVKTDVSLLIVERYKTVFNSFLKAESITLPTFQDSTANILKQDLIPTTPVKLYFNGKGNISAIDYMGAQGDVQKFVEQISSQ